MSKETTGSAPPDPKRAKDRSVWDVAKAAFENRLIEGDGPVERVAKAKVSPSE